MTRSFALAATATLVLLTGCSDSGDAAAPSAASGATPDSAAFLADHDLDGMSARQIVEKLDASLDDREAGPVGSVRPAELILSDGDAKVTLPVDEFYLAIAPYVERTHECFNHNLATCQGELANAPIDVTIEAEGKTLIHKTVTTQANGFAGFWLPRDLSGTVTVSYAGKSVTAPFATGSDDPTCVTTMQLV